MNAFETGAILNDASHLTLLAPVPGAFGQECRVIVLFEHSENFPAAWPPNFFDEIQIDDPTFERSAQGKTPSIAAFDE